MSRGDQLKQFVNRVMAVEPQYIDIFGNGVPGMAGRSAATAGAANAGVDTVNHLRLQAIAFARLYMDTRASLQKVHEAAQAVEGRLTVCITLGVLSEAEAQALIDILHELLQKR